MKNRGIIRRMEEIWRMWLIVRLFKQRQLLMVVWDEIEIQQDPNDKVKLSESVQKLGKVLMQTRDPRTRRSSLIQHFGSDRLRKKHSTNKVFFQKLAKAGEKEKEEHNDLTRKFMEDAQLRIGSCIDAGYIKEDESDVRYIQLPLKGKRFASISGLLKTWVEELGITWSIMLSLILGGIGGFASKNTWELLRFLWDVLSSKAGL